MDAITLQTKLYQGYANAALRIGTDYTIYRPDTAFDPFRKSIATFKASFNAKDFTYRKALIKADPIFYGIFNGSETAAGDYLVGASTFFIASQAPLLPIVCIACNGAIAIRRVKASMTVGAVGYSGLSNDNENFILGSEQMLWPAALQLRGHEETGMRLPTSNKEAAWQTLLPISIPITPQVGDKVTDNLNRNYFVQAAAITHLGWQLEMIEAHT